MSSVKISALALFALSASAQLYPRAANSSILVGTAVVTSAAPAPTLAHLPSYEVDGKYWGYEGCAASALGFPGFTQVPVTLNDVEACIAACSVLNSEYAGLLESACFCADHTDEATIFVPDEACDFSCPGNLAEACGGSATGITSLRKRQATVPPGALLSLYQVIQVIPAGVYTTVFTTEYVSVCPTGLTTIPYSTTITTSHCGCTDITPPASIPLTTSVGSCGCGEGGAQQTYTVTVPAAVCPTSTQTVAVVSATPTISTVTLSACPGGNGGNGGSPTAAPAASPAAGHCPGGCGNNGPAVVNSAPVAPAPAPSPVASNGNAATATAAAAGSTFTGAASKKAAGGLVAVIAVGAFALL